MTSMTGYAYKEAADAYGTVSVEIKSVNSRFLDLSVTVPPFLGQLENCIRAQISEKIIRGKVDVSVRVRDTKCTEKVSADVDAARSYASAITQIAEALGIKAADVPLSLIIAQPGVLNIDRDYDIESYWKRIVPVFNDSFAVFTSDRDREGQNLFRDLSEKLTVLDGAAVFFTGWQPKMEALFREQITRKFHELLGDHADDQRIMTETAAMLVKYTINEEIVRLKSHLAALRSEMGENQAPGKKIDFLCQEINREINTIGSKNQFSEVGAMVITAKDALENIREQARNIE
jgi:uncharacterized protein (TIGR00255 family)